MFRETVEYDAAEFLTSMLDAREEGVGGALRTVGVAEEVLAARGIAPVGRRVDLVKAIFEEKGVPLGRGSRAFVEGSTWIVRNRDGSTEKLVDWDRRTRGG